MEESHAHTHSYEPMKADLVRRLRRIEGQVRGLQKMVEDGRYCVDILVQIAAVKSALHQVGLSILESHTRGCVAEALRERDREEEKVDELVQVLRQFTKL